MDERFAALDRAAAAVGARTPDAVEERIAALQDELRDDEAAAQGRAPRPAAARSPATSPRRPRSSAPGSRSSAAALTSTSIDELKGFAKDIRGSLPSGVIALGLDADEPQLFVTVSDDLVARGIAAGPLVQRP